MEIGVDIISIQKIKKLIDKWENRFLDRIYTVREKEICFKRKNYEECFAGKFAAKEAIFKTLGDENIILKDIEIINRQVFIKGIFNENIKISISHEKNYAIACAVKIN